MLTSLRYSLVFMLRVNLRVAVDLCEMSRMERRKLLHNSYRKYL